MPGHVRLYGRVVRPGFSIAATTRLVVAGGVFCFIWFAVLGHYYVRAPSISRETVLEARESPPDLVLRELQNFRLLKLGPSDERELAGVAEKLLRGIADIPGYPVARIAVPFDPRDLDHAPPRWRLPLAGLEVPRILLDAYDATGREEFFLAARDAIRLWGEYEPRAWLPRGSLWNEHALAARVAVLTEFWRLYRHHPSYQAELGSAVLEQVARSAALLAKEGHFAFATNHGIMQNAALLHVSIAFPMLPEVQRYKDLALSRLRDQMQFYIDDEGVVLEHSAGYQQLGLELIATVCRYLTLLRQPIPDDWRRKFEHAEQVFSALRRRDGSLPTYGDTDGAGDELGPLTTAFDAHGRSEALRHRQSWEPAASLNFYPIAGHAIWWDRLADWPDERKLRQTVTTWSYFPGHGHKNADEMSVLVWGGGQQWWTDVGYWPYVMAGRLDAESWQGGNAPHLVMESAASLRSTSVLSSGWSNRLAALDLERRGPGQYTARRQVVHVKPDVWLIVDHVAGGGARKTTTTWTTSPDVTLSRGTVPRSYVLAARYSGMQLSNFVLGSPGTSIREFHGSWSPFAGWHVVGGIPRPAPAIVIEQPARDSWSAVVWSLEDRHADSTRFLDQARVSRWHHAEDWAVELTMRSATCEVERQGNRIVIRDVRRRHVIETMALTPGPDVTDAIAPLRASFATAATAYPRFYDLLRRRTIVTLLLLVVLLSQEAFFWFIRRKHSHQYRPLWVFSLLGWMGVGCWLTLSLLKG